VGIPGKPDKPREVPRIWDEIQKKLDEQGYPIKQGTIQDASFVTSDPGHAPANKARGDTSKPG